MQNHAKPNQDDERTAKPCVMLLNNFWGVSGFCPEYNALVPSSFILSFKITLMPSSSKLLSLRPPLSGRSEAPSALAVQIPDPAKDSDVLHTAHSGTPGFGGRTPGFGSGARKNHVEELPTVE